MGLVTACRGSVRCAASALAAWGDSRTHSRGRSRLCAHRCRAWPKPTPAATPAEQARQDGYDALRAARAASPLPGYPYAAAMGDAHPAA
ncbi:MULTISPECIES: hypothetical protein [unclassified Streptomyces]|uniref:hypothetical protein n=1 Tax=unclassified Streptomyces TaxID=2593676 RepID=UPI002E168997|nr:hypothetical protein OG457_44450 [Streptomyces sp. NBC_01207]WTA23877.1 hypothetical protein OG365_38110 [Streptomyces sp. NBC_00853]